MPVFTRLVRVLRVVTVGHLVSLTRLGGETGMPAISSMSIRISSSAKTSFSPSRRGSTGATVAGVFVGEKVKPPGPTSSLDVSGEMGVDVPEGAGVPSGLEKLSLRFHARVTAGERFELDRGAKGVRRRGVD